ILLLGLVASTVEFAACGGGKDAAPAPTGTNTPEATGSLSLPALTQTAPASLTPTPAPVFTPSTGARQRTGLSNDPRPTQPDEYRTVAQKPPESFMPWNRTDVVLYDVEARTERNLGPGASALFSPDGTSLAWTTGSLSDDAGSELKVLVVATGEVRTLGPA